MSNRIKVDELVIGGGLTGLTYANVAAAFGRNVAIVEKHTKPGGYATNFTRKRKYVFDCSLHKITGLGPQGNLQNALERAGLMEHIEFHYYRHLTTFILGENRISLPCDGESLFRELKQRFPDQADALDQFYRDIHSLGYHNYMFARIALGEHELDPELLVESRKLSRITAYQYFMRLFTDASLITMLCALAINLGVEAYEVDALYFLHFAYTFFMTRKGYIKGSSQNLSDTLAKQFVQRGGRIFLGEPLVGIDVNSENKVTGVRSRRREFDTKHVVFTGCPNQIVTLLPSRTVPEEFSQKLDRLQFGLGAFVVYLGLSVPPTEIGMTEPDYLIADESYIGQAAEACHSDTRYDRWPLSISNYYALDSDYGFVVQLEMLEQQGDWLELSREDYVAKKKLLAEKVIDRASKYFPGLRAAIDYVDVSTPRTNMKYTNSGGGSSFGYKPAPGRNLRFLQTPPAEGIQFVGTWVNGAGYEPAMCLGFTMAMLRQRKLSENGTGAEG